VLEAGVLPEAAGHAQGRERNRGCRQKGGLIEMLYAQDQEHWRVRCQKHHEVFREDGCRPLWEQEQREESCGGQSIVIACVVILLCLPVLGQATYKGGKSVGTTTYRVSQGSVGSGENIYCLPGTGEITEGIPTWGTAEGVAQLPTRCINTAVSSTASGTRIGGGSAVSFTPASATLLNNVLASAGAGPGVNLDGTTGGSNHLACGDTMVVAAGATYTGPFTFPSLPCDGGHWIVVRTSQIANANFPAEGTRATPCIAGISNDAANGRNAPGYPDYPCPSYPAVLTAKITGSTSPTDPAIQFGSGANHYRFVGIEVRKYPNTQSDQLIQLAADGSTQGANHIIFDRMIIHGDPWTTASVAGDEVQNGLSAKNGQWVALINSWNFDTYCNSSCVDSHSFSGGAGSFGNGPYKLYNNLLASAGEPWFTGGGGQGVGTLNAYDWPTTR
jgi:hypothetical protein